jgi:peptide-methionine (R)-S-oxide reductase
VSEPFAGPKSKVGEALTRRAWLVGGAGTAALAGLWWLSEGDVRAGEFEVTKPDAQWRAELKPAQYRILRQHGTERPNSSPLNREHRAGTFACAGCDLPLFSSQTKYESHTGWPSFYAPLPAAVGTKPDRTLFLMRTEVHCRRCGGHLGHVFGDGPPPTGLRYCINGLALAFSPDPARGG